MDLTKEALAYIENLAIAAAGVQVTAAGQEVSAAKHYVIEEPRAEAMKATTLQAIIDYLKTQKDSSQSMVLHVASPTRVVLLGSVNGDRKRDRWIEAEAVIPHISWDHWYDLEDINIKLQAGFAPTEQAQQLKAILGNVVAENAISRGDDGVTQSVVTRQGITTGEKTTVPNRVTLQPFRTFVEVEQPASDFILRMRSNGDDVYAKLVEADGGAWQIAAIANIRNWLQQQLEDHDMTAEQPLLENLTIIS